MLGIQGENVDGGRVNTGSDQGREGNLQSVSRKRFCVVFWELPTLGKIVSEVESCWVSGGSAETGSLLARPAKLKGGWVEASCSAGL